MPRQRSVFAVQSSSGRSTPWTDQRLINLYVERGAPDAKSKAIAYGTPGHKTFATFPSGKVRGAAVQDQTVFVVCGQTVYTVDSSGNTTALTGSVPGTDLVKMEAGRDNVVILRDNGTAYNYDGTDVSEITDNDLPSVGDTTYQDGYLVYSEKGTDQWYVSNLFDPETVDPLDFATAESAGDRIVGLISDRQELFIFGVRTLEVWYNAGSDFPFARRQVVNRGCLARDSIVDFDNSIIWLGDDGVVYRAAGYSPQRISTHAVEYAISQDVAPESARAFEYTQEGHKFYCLQLSDETWVYDAATGLWHERQSYQDKPWRIDGTVEAYGKTLAFASDAGKLYELDLDTYTEDGETIRRIAQTPPIHADRRRAFMPRFEAEIEVGVGLSVGQGSDPQAMLRWSDDGGKTFSNQLWRDMGEIGEYRQRVVWHRLGSFRQRTMQLVISDPVKVAITAMVADIEVGNG
jgi:hypothetical protein